MVDILIGVCALPFVFLVIILFGSIIYITDKGPIFYNSERLGKDGKTFKMYKLRSMKMNAPDIRNSDGSTFNGDNDPRVTRIGRFLRKTSLDELPQFINVFIGNMSIVGPRPFLTTHYYGFERLSEPMKKRLRVRPGITGYSQAYYRNSISQEQKILNDVYYVEHVSFLLDCKIILKTIKSVVKSENIYVSENSKPESKK